MAFAWQVMFLNLETFQITKHTVIWGENSSRIMWLTHCHKPSPSHHHFYGWYGYHSQSWVVYDIVLPTLFQNQYAIVT